MLQCAQHRACGVGCAGLAQGQQGHKLLQGTGVHCMTIYTSCGFIPQSYSCRSTFICHSCFFPNSTECRGVIFRR